jgi:CRISPR-associated protein Cas6
LEPSESLRARIVVIKSAHEERVEPVSFLRSLDRQIEALGVSCKAQLERTRDRGNPDCLARRVVSVKENIIVGYGVLLSGLNEADSIKIQIAGIGGRRRMGCGLFEPVKSVAAVATT